MQPRSTANPESATQPTPFTVRLPAELADALRNYAFVTSTSANDVVKRALVEYLQAHARTDMVRKAFETVLEQHGLAFDKLKDM
jgi:predicted transcriptional regulator